MLAGSPQSSSLHRRQSSRGKWRVRGRPDKTQARPSCTQWDEKGKLNLDTTSTTRNSGTEEEVLRGPRHPGLEQRLKDACLKWDEFCWGHLVFSWGHIHKEKLYAPILILLNQPAAVIVQGSQSVIQQKVLQPSATMTVNPQTPSVKRESQSCFNL